MADIEKTPIGLFDEFCAIMLAGAELLLYLVKSADDYSV